MLNFAGARSFKLAAALFVAMGLAACSKNPMTDPTGAGVGGPGGPGGRGGIRHGLRFGSGAVQNRSAGQPARRRSVHGRPVPLEHRPERQPPAFGKKKMHKQEDRAGVEARQAFCSFKRLTHLL